MSQSVDSAIKKIFSICQGPRFSSQHQHGSSHLSNSNCSGSNALFWPLTALHACGARLPMQTKRHSNICNLRSSSNYLGQI